LLIFQELNICIKVSETKNKSVLSQEKKKRLSTFIDSDYFKWNAFQQKQRLDAGFLS
jgi:hypothetical protein